MSLVRPSFVLGPRSAPFSFSAFGQPTSLPSVNLPSLMPPPTVSPLLFSPGHDASSGEKRSFFYGVDDSGLGDSWDSGRFSQDSMRSVSASPATAESPTTPGFGLRARMRAMRAGSVSTTFPGTELSPSPQPIGEDGFVIRRALSRPQPVPVDVGDTPGLKRSRSMVKLHKRDCCVPSTLAPNLFLGSIGTVSNVTSLAEKNVRTIFNFHREASDFAEYTIPTEVLHRPIDDVVSQPIHASFLPFYAELKAKVSLNPTARFLVNCEYGISRSGVMGVSVLLHAALDPQAHPGLVNAEVTSLIKAALPDQSSFSLVLAIVDCIQTQQKSQNVPHFDDRLLAPNPGFLLQLACYLESLRTKQPITKPVFTQFQKECSQFVSLYEQKMGGPFGIHNGFDMKKRQEMESVKFEDFFPQV